MLAFRYIAFSAFVNFLFLAAAPVLAAEPYSDHSFHSGVFDGPRSYRLFLPASYLSETNEPNSQDQYPVIYYCHGHSNRYTLEGNEESKKTLQEIIAYVESHDVIVVAVDGYVKEHYEGFYGGSPWDVREEGGEYDFGVYFNELVRHIDSTYRTRVSRKSRGISGLSMGGFMSLYLSARYPSLIGSASSFNPGPEFFVGDTGSRVLWRPKDHVHCHTNTMVQLIRASGDYISQYTEETHAAYAKASAVDFEFRQDTYHRHATTSLDKTFDFHMRAFDNAKLDETPAYWNTSNAYRQFSTWGYDIRVASQGKTMVFLADVCPAGFRLSTRRWMPDGPPAEQADVEITTAPHYQPSKTYRVIDFDYSSGNTVSIETKADSAGRLTIGSTGSGHIVSILGPSVEQPAPVLLPMTEKDFLRLSPGIIQSLPLRVYNPGSKPLRNVRVRLSSDYPTVEFTQEGASLGNLAPGQVANVGDSIQFRCVAGSDLFAPTRFTFAIEAEGHASQEIPLDVLLIPDNLENPAVVKILDGRTETFTVFRQKGNQGGGGPVERTVTEGKGNGNGQLEPGEEATFWVKIPQGLDPFDKNNWIRAKVYFDTPWLQEIEAIQETKQREWTGAKHLSSVLLLSEQAPSKTRISLLLDCETRSFHYTPDVRYGSEPLYQAYQLHDQRLKHYEFEIGSPHNSGVEK